MVYVAIDTVINPENLLADKEAAIILNWWLAKTRSQAEKAVAKKLKIMGEKFFLPIIVIEKTAGGRRVVCNAPLYPGYLFIAGEEDTPQHVFPSSHIVCMNQVRDKRTLLNQLCLTWQFMQSRRVIRLEGKCDSGQLVRVSSGPLCGICGRLIDEERTPRRLVVSGILTCGDVSIELQKDEVLM
jgi:transcription antitermination factor NusG